MDKKSNRRMSSIARKLNMSRWLKTLEGVILFNLLLVMMVETGRYGNLVYKDGQFAKDIYISGNFTYSSTKLVIGDGTSDGEVEIYLAKEIYTFRKYIVVLLTFELLYLFGALWGTNEIRRKLKPLNDLAIKAESISQVAFDADKMGNLEAAINHISPEGPDASIHTGDKDLQSIEVALNNLLTKMKESERKQARFVSDASHELRTPIAVIQGYVNMLDRWGKDDEEVLKESIEALKSESQNMKELVDQLLFLARGDNGRNTLKKEKINVGNLIQDVWEESIMIDENHEYLLSSKHECFINGDIAMIKQCMRIFIQNAVKYSKDGATIKLGAIANGDKATLFVQDEGIGMDEQDVVHIFERFYRSDEARNSSTGGTGLGLAIAKWIVDAHYGTVEVVSRKDIGTRFSVSFERV